MHDPKCFELASYFLPKDASERAKNALSEQIQEAVEMWLCNLDGDASDVFLSSLESGGFQQSTSKRAEGLFTRARPLAGAQRTD